MINVAKVKRDVEQAVDAAEIPLHAWVANNRAALRTCAQGAGAMVTLRVALTYLFSQGLIELTGQSRDLFAHEVDPQFEEGLRQVLAHEAHLSKTVGA